MTDKNHNEKTQNSPDDELLCNRVEHASDEIADSEMESVSGGAVYMKVDGYTEQEEKNRRFLAG